MPKVLSIDLACTAMNVGFCLLTCQVEGQIDCSFPKPGDFGLSDPLVPHDVARSIYQFCRHTGSGVVLLDGPQGWKDPNSDLQHSRLCERLLNAPAKTGEIGRVKPKAYTRFVEFSIAVFAKLIEAGALLACRPEIIPPDAKLLALETLPLAAWRALAISPLPAKSRATTQDLEVRIERLKREVTGLHLGGEVPSHDELQALVAGLAGIAVLLGDSSGYTPVGSPPVWRDGVCLEGFIVNPCLSRHHNNESISHP